MKHPPDVTPAALEKAALGYLERYAASAETLRRVLMRRVARAERAGVIGHADGKAMIEVVIEKMTARRLLDDALFAEGRAGSLSRKGLSRAMIARTLAAKGVGRDDIAKALDGLAAAGEDDLLAALRFARRRRLGPFRPAAERAARHDRDLAVLARGGFSLEIARLVIGADSIAALEDEIALRR